MDWIEPSLMPNLRRWCFLALGPLFCSGVALATELPDWLHPGLMPGEKIVQSYAVPKVEPAQWLVLSREEGPSPSRPDSQRIEREVLRAVLYRKTPAGAAVVWKIQEENDCPGEDSSALFYTRYVSITDLNADGVPEVAVPYRISCGGGVDPASIKIIVREGERKYALRGESRIVMSGQSAAKGTGGTWTMDDALKQPANAALRKLVLDIWDKISVERY